MVVTLLWFLGILCGITWLAISSSNFLPTKLHPNPVKLIQVWSSHLLAFLLALRNACSIAHPTGPSWFPSSALSWNLDPLAILVFLPELSPGGMLSYCLWLRTGKGSWQTFAPKGKSRLWLCNFSAAPLCTSHCLLDPSCCYSSLLVRSGKLLRLCSNPKVASTLLTYRLSSFLNSMSLNSSSRSSIPVITFSAP